MLGSCMLLLLTELSADLHVLQWNAHWQCFARNQNDCRRQAQSILHGMLQDPDIDFANVIEFDDVNNLASLPHTWGRLQTTCGRDRVALLYNTSKWRTSSLGGSWKAGCMISEGRPFIAQAFDRGDSAREGSSDAVGGVVVIAAHFPHPSSFGKRLSDDLVLPLRLAIQAVMEASATRKVVLIADTNEFTSTSSDMIKSYLELPGNTTMSTSLEQTCCFDNGFPTQDTHDRIAACCCSGIEIVDLMDSPLPLVAQQVHPVTHKKAAILKIAEAHTGSAVTTSSTSTTSMTTTTKISTTSFEAVASTSPGANIATTIVATSTASTTTTTASTTTTPATTTATTTTKTTTTTSTTSFETVASTSPGAKIATSAASPIEMYYHLIVVGGLACVFLVGLVAKCGRARVQPSARDLEVGSDDQ